MFGQVQNLFKDAPDLLAEFKDFLPEIGAALTVPQLLAPNGPSSWNSNEPPPPPPPVPQEKQAVKKPAPSTTKRRKRPTEKDTTPAPAPKAGASTSRVRLHLQPTARSNIESRQQRNPNTIMEKSPCRPPFRRFHLHLLHHYHHPMGTGTLMPAPR